MNFCFSYFIKKNSFSSYVSQRSSCTIQTTKTSWVWPGDLVSLEWTAKEVGSWGNSCLACLFDPWKPPLRALSIHAFASPLSSWYLETRFWENPHNQRGSGKWPSADDCQWPALGLNGQEDFRWSKNTAEERRWGAHRGSSLRAPQPNWLFTAWVDIIFPSLTYVTDGYYNVTLAFTSQLCCLNESGPEAVIALITEGNRWFTGLSGWGEPER